MHITTGVRAQSEVAMAKRKKPQFRMTPQAFEPTLKQRQDVRNMARDGRFSQETMCQWVINPATGKPIAIETLLKHFADELRLGPIEAHMMVSGRLFQLLKTANLPTVQYYERTRRQIFDAPQEVNVSVKGEVKHEHNWKPDANSIREVLSVLRDKTK